MVRALIVQSLCSIARGWHPRKGASKDAAVQQASRLTRAGCANVERVERRSVDIESVVDALREREVGRALGVEHEQHGEPNTKVLIACYFCCHADGDSGGRWCVGLSGDESEGAERDGQCKEKHGRSGRHGLRRRKGGSGRVRDVRCREGGRMGYGMVVATVRAG